MNSLIRIAEFRHSNVLKWLFAILLALHFTSCSNYNKLRFSKAKSNPSVSVQHNHTEQHTEENVVEPIHTESSQIPGDSVVPETTFKDFPTEESFNTTEPPGTITEEKIRRSYTNEQPKLATRKKVNFNYSDTEANSLFTTAIVLFALGLITFGVTWLIGLIPYIKGLIVYRRIKKNATKSTKIKFWFATALLIFIPLVAAVVILLMMAAFQPIGPIQLGLGG